MNSGQNIPKQTAILINLTQKKFSFVNNINTDICCWVNPICKEQHTQRTQEQEDGNARTGTIQEQITA